jgi:hypothetical protein
LSGGCHSPMTSVPPGTAPAGGWKFVPNIAASRADVGLAAGPDGTVLGAVDEAGVDAAGTDGTVVAVVPPQAANTIAETASRLPKRFRIYSPPAGTRPRVIRTRRVAFLW